MARGTGDDASAADRRAVERDARRAAALRANLRRRKAQSRARQDAPPPDTDAGHPGAAPPPLPHADDDAAT